MKLKAIFSKKIILTVAIGLGFAVTQLSAQTAPGGNVGKQTNTDNGNLGTSNTTVKVIDNKGTIKYLQANNGITTITDAAPDGGIVTTWQLGGTLTADTNIETGAQEFKIDLNDGTDQGTFVLEDVEVSALSADDGTGTGWTLLVRDETTGQVKKVVPDALVSGIYQDYTQGANASADVPITVTGLPALDPATTRAKLFVFRNGAKLRAGTDFVVTADTITITYDAADLPMYAGDIIEIQYIK